MCQLIGTDIRLIEEISLGFGDGNHQGGPANFLQLERTGQVSVKSNMATSNGVWLNCCA